MAFVFSLIRDASCFLSILYVPCSTSTITGVAPTWHTTLAVAVYVYAGTITSSPGPIPKIRRVISIPAVDEARHAALPVLHLLATTFSSSLVFGPVVIHPDFNESTTSFISSSVISGGENGIFLKSSVVSIINSNLLSVFNKRNKCIFIIESGIFHYNV